MVCLTLRFFATGCILQAAGDFSGVDKSTASRVIDKVSRAIAHMHETYITLPDEEINIVRQGFFNISRFPRCIGALDCTHVRIQSPGGEEPENFRNRKGYFSFNVQAICDSQLKIWDIVCRWPGSAHDANIFRNSIVRARFENGEFGDNLLVGDSGYGNKPYLITPLSNPITPVEHLFNESQIRTRNPIERCFGVLKRRFPLLALGIKLNVRKVEAIVVSCAVLHNIACMLRDDVPLVNEEVEAALELGNIPIPVVVQPGVENIALNNIVRQALITEYFQPLLNNVAHE